MPSITSPALRFALLALCATLGACAGTGPAMTPGSSVTGTRFVHHVELQGAVRNASRVHVYLEGDGRPFATRHLPAGDPTPRRRLARELMARDPAPAIYLARPCYEGQAAAEACNASLWTDARYGETVVGSLAAALEHLQASHGFERVTLIGYSGGGVLAMLLAERLAMVDRVVTIAANLDLAAWTARHGYSPLRNSLDPAQGPALGSGVSQVHFVGGQDTNVPPSLVRRALARQAGARLVVVAEAGHARGWQALWPSLLSRAADDARP